MKLYIKGNAHIPQRFWDVALVKENDIHQIKILEDNHFRCSRDATPTEVKRFKTGDGYYSLGDIADQFFHTPEMIDESEIDVFVHPEKYGYVQCKHCNGYGSSLKEDALKCSKCSGLGLVKKTDTLPTRPLNIDEMLEHKLRGGILVEGEEETQC